MIRQHIQNLCTYVCLASELQESIYIDSNFFFKFRMHFSSEYSSRIKIGRDLEYLFEEKENFI